MATKNLVPRATGEGQLGTTNKNWQHVFAVQGNFNQLKNTSNAELFVSSNSSTLTIAHNAATNQYDFTALGGGASTGTAVDGIVHSADGSGGLKAELWKFVGHDFLPEATDSRSIGSSAKKLANIFSTSSVLDTVDTDKIKFDNNDDTSYYEITLNEASERLKLTKYDNTADPAVIDTNFGSQGIKEIAYTSDSLSLGESSLNSLSDINYNGVLGQNQFLITELVPNSDPASYRLTNKSVADTRSVLALSTTSNVQFGTLKLTASDSNNNELGLDVVKSASFGDYTGNDAVIIDNSRVIYGKIANNSNIALTIGNNANHKTELKGSLIISEINLPVDTALNINPDSNSNSNKKIDVSGLDIVGLDATPGGATSAASKAYVDSIAQGLSTKESVRAATNGNNIAGTYDNSPAAPTLTVTASGTPTFDGVTLQQNDRFLIKDQTNKIQNGIYTCTTVGDVNTQSVFTRSSDLNKAAQASGSFVFVAEGADNNGKGFVCNSPDANDTVGTDNLLFTGFSSAGQITTGTGIIKTGSKIAVDGVLAQLDDLSPLADGNDDGKFIVATEGATFNYESGSIARDSLGLGEEDNVTFKGLVAYDDGVKSEFFHIASSGNNNNYIRLKTQTNIGASYTLILPSTPPTLNDQVLARAGGSGSTYSLKWATPASTDTSDFLLKSDNLQSLTDKPASRDSLQLGTTNDVQFKSLDATDLIKSKKLELIAATDGTSKITVKTPDGLSEDYLLNLPATIPTTSGQVLSVNSVDTNAKTVELKWDTPAEDTTKLATANALNEFNTDELKTSARSNLGLGTAATLAAGTAENNLVKLIADANDGNAVKLPALDGSLLTNVTASVELLSDLSPQLGGDLDLNNKVLFDENKASEMKINSDFATNTNNLQLGFPRNTSRNIDSLIKFDSAKSYAQDTTGLFSATGKSEGVIITDIVRISDDIGIEKMLINNNQQTSPLSRANNGEFSLQVTNKSLLNIGDIVYLGNFKINNHSFDGLWMVSQFSDNSTITGNANKGISLTPHAVESNANKRSSPYNQSFAWMYNTLPRALFGIINNDLRALDDTIIPASDWGYISGGNLTVLEGISAGKDGIPISNETYETNSGSYKFETLDAFLVKVNISFIKTENSVEVVNGQNTLKRKTKLYSGSNFGFNDVWHNRAKAGGGNNDSYPSSYIRAQINKLDSSKNGFKSYDGENAVTALGYDAVEKDLTDSLSKISEDLQPELGGDLNTKGKMIISTESNMPAAAYDTQSEYSLLYKNGLNGRSAGSAAPELGLNTQHAIEMRSYNGGIRLWASNNKNIVLSTYDSSGNNEQGLVHVPGTIKFGQNSLFISEDLTDPNNPVATLKVPNGKTLKIVAEDDGNNKGKVEIKGITFEKDTSDNDNVKVSAPSGKVVKFSERPKIGEGTDEETKVPNATTQNDKLPVIKDNYDNLFTHNLATTDMGRDIIFIGTTTQTRYIRLPDKANLSNGAYIKITIIFESTNNKHKTRTRIQPYSANLSAGIRINKTISYYNISATNKLTTSVECIWWKDYVGTGTAEYPQGTWLIL